MLDSKPASMPLKEYMMTETRFSTVFRNNPIMAEALFTEAEENAKNRWEHLERLSVEMWELGFRR